MILLHSCSDDLSITIRSKNPSRYFDVVVVDHFTGIVYCSDLCYRRAERSDCDSDYCTLLSVLSSSRPETSSAQEIRTSVNLSWSSTTENTHCHDTVLSVTLHGQIIRSVRSRSAWSTANVNNQYDTFASRSTLDDGCLPEWYPHLSATKDEGAREKHPAVYRSPFHVQRNFSRNSLQATGQPSVHK